MELNNLEIYGLALELGEKIWFNVNKWEYLPKNKIGLQFVKSTDSIAANISEGFGRYHYKEKKNFGYFTRGSLFESITCLEKAKNRGLISKIEQVRNKK